MAGLASQREGLLDWLADLIKDIFAAFIAQSIEWQYITANCKWHLLTGRITQTFQKRTSVRFCEMAGKVLLKLFLLCR